MLTCQTLVFLSNILIFCVTQDYPDDIIRVTSKLSPGYPSNSSLVQSLGNISLEHDFSVFPGLELSLCSRNKFDEFLNLLHLMPFKNAQTIF